LDPQLSLAYLTRGKCLELKGDRFGALSDLTKFIELEPRDARGYKMRAAAYSRFVDLAKAAADEKKAAEL
jgi:Flp pilus assembly protein TadD